LDFSTNNIIDNEINLIKLEEISYKLFGIQSRNDFLEDLNKKIIEEVKLNKIKSN
jgi:hypothetical protein